MNGRKQAAQIVLVDGGKYQQGRIDNAPLSHHNKDVTKEATEQATIGIKQIVELVPPTDCVITIAHK